MRKRSTQRSQRSQRRIVFSVISVFSVLIVVSLIPAWGQTSPKFDSNRAWEHLRQLVERHIYSGPVARDYVPRDKRS
jgi:hypothetical protein